MVRKDHYYFRNCSDSWKLTLAVPSALSKGVLIYLALKPPSNFITDKMFSAPVVNCSAAQSSLSFPLGEIMTNEKVSLQGWSERLLKVISALTEDDDGYKDPIIATVEFAKAGKDMVLAWLRSLYKFVREGLGLVASAISSWARTCILASRVLLEMLKNGSQTVYSGVVRFVNAVFGTKFDPEFEGIQIQSNQEEEENVPSYFVKIVLAFADGIVSLVSGVCEGLSSILTKTSDSISSVSRLVSNLKNIGITDSLKRIANYVYYLFTGSNYFIDVVVMDAFRLLQDKYDYSALIEMTDAELAAYKQVLTTLYLDVVKYEPNRFNASYNTMLRMADAAQADVAGREFMKSYYSLVSLLEQFEESSSPDHQLHTDICNGVKDLGSTFDYVLAECPGYSKYSLLLKRVTDRAATSMAAISAKTRVKPVVVCIRGQSGIGKTRVLNALIEDIPAALTQHFGPFSDETAQARYLAHALNPSALTYSCVTEPEKHDSTYARQMFVVFNELHSHITVASRQAWAEKFVAFIDDSPHNLKRAFSDKGQVYMVSPFVFASGNFDNHTIVMNDAMAQHRRIEFDLIALPAKKVADRVDPRVDVRFEFSPECVRVLGSNVTPSAFLSTVIGKQKIGSKFDYQALLDMIVGVYVSRLAEASVVAPPRLSSVLPNQFLDLMPQPASRPMVIPDDVEVQGFEEDFGNYKDDWGRTQADAEGCAYEMKLFLKKNFPYVCVSTGELYKAVRDDVFSTMDTIADDIRIALPANRFSQWMLFSRSLFSLRKKYATCTIPDKAGFRQLRRSMSYIRSLFKCIRSNIGRYTEEQDIADAVESFMDATPAQKTKLNSLFRKRYQLEIIIKPQSSVNGKTIYAASTRKITYTTAQQVAYRQRLAANRARGSAQGADPRPRDSVVKAPVRRGPTDEQVRRKRKQVRAVQRQNKAERVGLQVGEIFMLPNIYLHDRYQDWLDNSDNFEFLNIPNELFSIKRNWLLQRYVVDDCFHSYAFKDELNLMRSKDRCLVVSYLKALFSRIDIHLSTEAAIQLLSFRVINSKNFRSWQSVTHTGLRYVDEIVDFAIRRYNSECDSVVVANFLVIALFSGPTFESIADVPAMWWAVNRHETMDFPILISSRGNFIRTQVEVDFRNAPLPTEVTSWGAVTEAGFYAVAFLALPFVIKRTLEFIVSLYRNCKDVYLDQDLIDKLDVLSEKGYDISITKSDTEEQAYFSPKHQMKGKHKDLLSAIRTKHGVKMVDTELHGCMSSPTLEKIMHNQYVMVAENGGVQIASLVFISGSTALMNKHVYLSLPERFCLIPYHSSDTGRYLNVIRARIQRVDSEFPLPDDSILVSIPNAPCHPKITQYFHKKNDAGSNGYFADAYMSYFDGVVSYVGDVQSVSECSRIRGPQNLNSLGTLPYVVTDVVRYHWAGTRKATCGSLLLGYHGNQWHILGMHTAGQPSGGIGFSVYLGDRNYSLQLPPIEQQGVDLNAFLPIDIYKDPVLPDLIDYVDGQHICAVTTSPYTPTNLVRTPYDSECDYPFAPAHIGRESYELGLEKEKKTSTCEKPTFALMSVLDTYNEEILRRALPMWETRIPTNLSRSSFDDVMDGVDGNTKFDTNSARGIRLQYLGIRKQDVFEIDHPSRAQLRKLVADYWRAADERGDFSAQIGYDKQKVEIRDIERVRAKKTRIFNITDFVDNIRLRQAFGQLVRCYPADSIYGPMTCGIDPRSLAWSTIASQFEKCDRVLSMDIYGFDYIVTTVIANLLDVIICHAYPTWADRLSAKWCFMSITHALRFSFARGRILHRGNTSGNWLTTWFNSFESAVQFSVAAITLAMIYNDDPLQQLFSLRLKVYSDDNISSLPAPWWTEKNLSIIFSKIMGITLTNTDKSDIVDVAESKRITDVDFLGRGFRYEHGVYYAPLAIDSLLAQLYYVKVPKKERDNAMFVLEQLQVNVDNVCSELAEFPHDDAVKYREMIGSRLREMGTCVHLTNTPLTEYRKVCNY